MMYRSMSPGRIDLGTPDCKISCDQTTYTAIQTLLPFNIKMKVVCIVVYGVWSCDILQSGVPRSSRTSGGKTKRIYMYIYINKLTFFVSRN